ncbi:MAG: PH domain-containing protein [Bacteroidota bacterium]
MKLFKSRKDTLSYCTFLGTALVGFVSLPFLGVLAIQFIVGFTISILLFFFYGTYYKIDGERFIYRTGPLVGKIAIEKIRSLTIGKTMWVGLKPATAQKGIIMQYNKYDEIYISPERVEEFVKAIIEVNAQVKVIYHEA